MTSMILDFLERKENGTLLIQKKAKLRELFLSEVELTESKDGYIHFGDKVMIMNQGRVLTATVRDDYTPHGPRWQCTAKTIYYGGFDVVGSLKTDKSYVFLVPKKFDHFR